MFLLIAAVVSTTATGWYFIAVDFRTGETVYRKHTGIGVGYNNWAGALFLHPAERRVDLAHALRPEVAHPLLELLLEVVARPRPEREHSEDGVHGAVDPGHTIFSI